MPPGKRPSLSARAAGVVLGKIGAVAAMPDRTVASANAPTATLEAGQKRSQITTYFTKPVQIGIPTAILFNGERLWTRVVLTLETAGPVAVGNMSGITPVLSGKGQLLPIGVPMPFTLAKGTRLYIASTSVNRVKVLIEPVPWLEQITGLLIQMVGRLGGGR